MYNHVSFSEKTPILNRVIFLKKEKMTVVSLLLVCICCLAIMVAGGYFYLTRGLKPVDNDASSVPYSFEKPENKGVLLDFSGDITFVYLDFEKEKLSVILPPESQVGTELYGYPVDCRVKADYALLADIIDFAGGIILTENETETRCTGVQITERLSRTSDVTKLKRGVISALMAGIGDVGLDLSTLKYIIENSETDLTVPLCYSWPNYLKSLCKNGTIIN